MLIASRIIETKKGFTCKGFFLAGSIKLTHLQQWIYGKAGESRNHGWGRTENLSVTLLVP